MPRLRRLLTITLTLCISAFALAGCGLFSNEFVSALEEVPNVASVESHGGGYSDAAWVAHITPVAGLSDDELVELLEAVATVTINATEATPSVYLDLPRFDIAVPTSSAEAAERIDRWTALRDDTRILDADIGEGTYLHASAVDAFALVDDVLGLVAESARGLVVSDADPDDRLTWSVAVRVDPECSEYEAQLDAFTSTFRAPFEAGQITAMALATCGESSVYAASRSTLLDLAVSASDEFARTGLDLPVTFRTSASSPESGTWIIEVAQATFTPAVAQLLATLFSSSLVAECDYHFDGTLVVNRAGSTSKQAIEDVVEESGAEVSLVILNR